MARALIIASVSRVNAEPRGLCHGLVCDRKRRQHEHATLAVLADNIAPIPSGMVLPRPVSAKIAARPRPSAQSTIARWCRKSASVSAAPLMPFAAVVSARLASHLNRLMLPWGYVVAHG